MAAMEKNNKNLNVPNLRFPKFSGEWERFRNCTLFRVISEKNKNYEFSTVLSASQTEGMVLRDSLGIDIKFEEDSIKTYKIVRNGDYVAHLRSFQGGFAFSDKTGVCSPAYTILRPSETISYGFLKPYFMSRKFIDSLRIVTYGIRDGKSISVEEWLKLYTCIPKKNEQQKISKFLRLIDNRIETQKKIIEKYESLIRGLYHSVFNNPSSILQLREVVSIVKGKQVNGEELLEEGKYYVMNGGTEPSGYLDEYNTPANTISISEGGNSCGYVQYNTEPFWSGGHCYSLHQKDEGVNYSYLYHFLKYKERDIMALRIGSGLPNVQKKDLERFEVRVLPIEQQDRVAEILEDISAKCDLEKKILQEWQWQKSFLLSNLFI